MLKVVELFGGIGACSKALERLGINYEIVDYVEIDKYAVKSFNAVHNTNFEPQDICEWDKDIEVDLIMHGSPCQDFSLAGKQAGGDAGSGTRSSLMYETIRIVEKLKPKYVIWENVKNLLSKKHRHNFDAYLETMERLGYTNYYQVLNAKDYGIPQNRERVFTISILGDGEFTFPSDNKTADLQTFLEKNVNLKNKPMCEKAFQKEYENIITSDKNIYQCDVKSGYQDCQVGIKLSPTIRAGNSSTHVLQKFEFPPKQELDKMPVDFIEEDVDKKYELSDSDLKTYQRDFGSKGKEINLYEPVPTLTASMGTGGGNVPYFAFPEKQELDLKLKDMLDEEVDEKYYLSSKMIDYITADNEKWTGNNDKSIINKEVASAINTGEGNRRCDASNYVSNDFSENFDLKSKCKRLKSLVEKTEFEQGKVLNMDLYNQTTNENISQCLTDPCHGVHRVFDGVRIRKLTPKECWRLMGFDDSDFDKASQVNSNTQLYKQAGNSIVVNVLEAILSNLDLPKKENKWDDLS